MMNLPSEDRDATMTVGEMEDVLANLLPEDDLDNPKMSKAFRRGVQYGTKKNPPNPGCKQECEGGALDANCEECCQTVAHRVDWNCDSENEDDRANCCTEWSEDC